MVRSRTIVILFTTFVVLQSSIYGVFKRQCNANSRGHLVSNPLWRLQRFSKLNSLIKIYWPFMYISSALRQGLIILISCDWMSDYHWLDCFIVGRGVFPGRTNKINSVMIAAAAILIGTYRATLQFLMPKHKFLGHEFILYELDQVIENELYFEKTLFDKTSAPMRDLVGRASPSYLADTISILGADQREPLKAQSLFGNSIFYIKNTLLLPAGSQEYILRPCRTSKSWDILNKFALYSTVQILFSLISWALIMFGLVGPAIMTEAGFELNYPSCVRWLSRQQQQVGVHNNFTSIYRPGKRLACDIPLDDIPTFLPYKGFHQVTPYSAYRFVGDFIENSIWYLDYNLLIMSQIFVVSLTSMDLIINAREIERRLRRIIGRLRMRTASRVLSPETPLGTLRRFRFCGAGEPKGHNHRSLPFGACHLPQLSTIQGLNHDHDQLELEVRHIQAIIIDHFLMVRSYNSFMSFFLFASLVIWFTYSFIFCVWMSKVKSKTVETDFVVSESLSFCIVLYLLAGAAITRSFNHRLYPLVASATAIDDNWKVTKRQWLIVMKYYSPRPLHSFMLLNSIEINWLFCLKVGLSCRSAVRCISLTPGPRVH